LPTLSIAEVVRDFPSFRVGFGMLSGLRPVDLPALERFVADTESEAVTLLAGTEIAALPEVVHWRAAYRAFGSKKTSYRDACEALLRRLSQGQGLPRIMPLVDLYNAISVMHRMPVGVDDLALSAPPNAFRYARPGDSFLDGGRAPPEEDPPAAGEIVYADSRHCLCRRWNWRQDARTRVRVDTREALVVIQTLEKDGEARLQRAIADFSELAERALGAASRWAIASVRTPEVSV
jgi:DNA/RNA-binding domain of Phe-tRNA-synthetase-like protein